MVAENDLKQEKKRKLESTAQQVEILNIKIYCPTSIDGNRDSN